MRVVALTLLAACGFNAPLPGGGPDDARGDGNTLDGVPDARPDAPPDALAACPPPPTGCVPFACAPSLNCYYHCGNTNPNRRTWANAKLACETAQLGCLATINNAAENACLAARVTAFPGFLWFGYVQSASGMEPAGGWGWTCLMSNFTPPWNTNPVEPNDASPGEDCAAMINNAGTWNDARCSDAIDYICELPR